MRLNLSLKDDLTLASLDRPPPRSLYYAVLAPVAQLDRAPGYELGGREFESLRARQQTTRSFTTLKPFESLTSDQY